MRFSSGISFLSIILVFVISFSIGGSGCANIIPPTGGPRDSLPPELVHVTPPDSTKNFAEKKITFTFDEFVELDNIQENLIVSPVPKINPIVEAKLRTVTVRIKDTLEPNVTYRINFGNAIKDINEGNIKRNFAYLFTTGNSIDEYRVRGKVIIAETGKPDSTLIVMLHRKGDDSAVIKEKPRYFTKLDSAGNFVFWNLAAGKYYLYALKDEGSTKLYTGKDQLFAFADSAVTASLTPDADTLYAFVAEEEKEDKPKATVRPTASKDRKPAEKVLRYTTNLEGNTHDLLKNLEFTFAAPLKRFDSSKLRLLDEKFQPLGGYNFRRDTSNKVFTLVNKWVAGTTYNLIIDKEFAEDSAGNKIPATDTLKFTTKKENEYGSLQIRITNLDLSRKPVLQIISNGNIVQSYPFVTREFFTKLFPPGEYDINVLYDSNGNGKWDTGQFFGKKRQPEKVQPINLKLKVRANWDNQQFITL